MEENQQPVVDSSSEISTEQMDNFFKEAAEAEKTERAVEVVKQPESQQSDENIQDDLTNAQQADEERHARNYKAAMHEERNRRKMIENELQNQRQVIHKMNNTFQQFVDAAQQAQLEKAQKSIPNYEDDPLEYQRRSIEELQDYTLKQRAYIEQQQRHQQQMAQRAAIEQKFMGDYKNAATHFAQQQKDFPEAYRYIANQRVSEFVAAGFDESQAVRLAQEDEAAIVAKAFRDGINPAERIYNLAKVRGFKTSENLEQNAFEKIDEKISNLEKGIRMNRSLNNMGGTSDSSNKLTLESLSQMDDEEFGKHWDKIVRRHPQFNK